MNTWLVGEGIFASLSSLDYLKLTELNSTDFATFDTLSRMIVSIYLLLHPDMNTWPVGEGMFARSYYCGLHKTDRINQTSRRWLELHHRFRRLTRLLYAYMLLQSRHEYMADW